MIFSYKLFIINRGFSVKKKLNAFYEKQTGNLYLHLVAPSFLAAIVFAASKFDKWYIILVGVLAAAMIPIHTYLSMTAAKTKIDAADLLRKELRRHKWLLGSIKEMVIRKLKRFKQKEYPFDEAEYIDAAMKNLAMLRQFYSKHTGDPENEFRVVFFKIGQDQKYLESQFFSTPNDDPPSSHNNTERQKAQFNKSRSQSLAVSAWKDLSYKIAENEDELTYLYAQQNQKIKSIIALPVCSGDVSEENLIGILTISSNKYFFKTADINRHKEYIDQFTLRFVFEYHKWEASKAKKTEV